MLHLKEGGSYKNNILMNIIWFPDKSRDPFASYDILSLECCDLEFESILMTYLFINKMHINGSFAHVKWNLLDSHVLAKHCEWKNMLDVTQSICNNINNINIKQTNDKSKTRARNAIHI